MKEKSVLDMEHATLFVTTKRGNQTVREHFGVGPAPRHKMASLIADMICELWKRDDVCRVEIERGDRRAPS